MEAAEQVFEQNGNLPKMTIDGVQFGFTFVKSRGTIKMFEEI